VSLSKLPSYLLLLGSRPALIDLFEYPMALHKKCFTVSEPRAVATGQRFNLRIVA
jgi:hypothetical protein